VRPSPRARAAFLLLYGALLAWQVDRWFFTPHGVVSTWAHRHDSLTVSAGSPRGISQTFVMGADGLDGVWLRPRTDSRRAMGSLIVDVLQLEGGARVRVERVALPAAHVVPGRNLHVPLRPIRQSRGRVYQIDIRHLNAAEGPALEFVTTREDALPRGRLFADGTEQWGDLVFATSARRATLPYWIHVLLRPWPGWTQSWPFVAAVMVMFNAVLAWACAMAVGFVGTAPGDADGRAPVATSSARALRQASIGATVSLVVGGLLVALWPTREQRAIDLIDALPDARLETSWPSLHAGITAEPVVFLGRVHRGIVAMPTSRIAWTMDVPRGAILRLGAAMRPDVWEREGDGIQMRVAVDDAAGRTVAADLTLFPFGVPAHRTLVPVEIPLHRWAGQRITIALESTPERWGNAVNDVPVWVAPMIEWPRNPAAGVARVVRR